MIRERFPHPDGKSEIINHKSEINLH